MVRLQHEPIRVEEIVKEVRRDSDGAVALFLGTVRDHNAGRRVVRLEYSAHPEMAHAEMTRIAEEARRRFEVSAVAIVHRVGSLDIGEVSVGVAVAAAHRADAVDACRFAIDTLKDRVPIWKKEHFEGGAVWIEGDGVVPAE
jgi:molybdopterin synthase catalytic subunit